MLVPNKEYHIWRCKPNWTFSIYQIKKGEILLTISAICSKKEIYLDKISTLGEEYLLFYLNRIEKYIIIDSENYSSNSSKTNVAIV